MTIGKDPHAGRDEWWVYDYFDEARAIDLARFAPVRILRGEMALSGFAWAESFEADHIEAARTPDEAWSDWSPTYAEPNGSTITSPKARYLQWRAVLTGKLDTPVLTSVTAA